MNNDLNQIRFYLANNIGQWRAFARSANVPYSTLEKVARGNTKNPRLATYTKIRNEWLRRTSRLAEGVEEDA